MNRVVIALSASLIGFSSEAWGQAGQPVIPLVSGRAVSATNPLPTTGSFTPSGTQDVNVIQWGGATGLKGNGVTGTGSPRVTIASDNTPFAVNIAAAQTIAVTNAGTFAVQAALNTAPSIANGNGVLIAPSSASTAGITPVVCGSASSSCVLKASAGNLYSVYAQCSVACWLQVFNATAAPSNGATTAGVASGNMVECIPIQAGGAGGLSSSGMPPSVYTVGITATISSTTCATLTLATTGFVKGLVQ